MSRYLLQNDSRGLDTDYYIIKEQLNKGKYVFNYIEVSEKELKDVGKIGDIPIGDIGFVTKFLKEFHGIKKENPIEIPEYLRTEEFLKRKYDIVTWDKIKETAKSGKYFIKDVSELKSFGEVIDTRYMDIDMYFEEPEYKFSTNLVLSKEHLYQVSSLFNIQSEYRVYVIGGRIEAISNYNGDCTVLPDTELIKKAVNLISLNEKWLKSYTIDVMVGPKGTAIIEIHSFASVGLYNTLWGTNLIYAYRDGIDYLINDNKELHEWKGE